MANEVNKTNKTCHKNLNFNVNMLNEDKQVNLCQEYQGKVIVVVNTASKCGFTDQYDDLEKIYKEYKDQGLVVLGFPSNDFANQEPGTEKQIKDFCRTTYGIEFPMFEKTRVAKRNASPFYQQLGEQMGYPKWNFYKYILNRNGDVVESYSSFTSPSSDKFINKIKSLL